MSTVDDPPLSVDRSRPEQIEPPEFSLLARCAAELVGTFVLVLGGCGAAIFAASAQSPSKTEVGIGYLGVALSFGLTVLVMAAAVGPISGGHFNPAVTIATVVAGRSKPGSIAPYALAQVVGASLAGLTLFVIASQRAGFDPVESGFASNGYGSRSPGGYGLLAGLIAEVVLTAIFVIVILAVTGSRTLPWAPVVIGLTLTLIHLVSIPITNTSVNPARSLGVVWFAGPAALGQVWLFVAAPVAGAVLGGALYRVGKVLTGPTRAR